MTPNKGDIFDRIMKFPIFNPFYPFYEKHKEVLMYLFFGGIGFFLNIFLFIGIDKLTPINALVNNIICWIVCVLFQFFTNRTWVFDGSTDNKYDFFKQITSFFGGRLLTLVIEEIIIGVFITWLELNSTIVKLVAQIVVIVLNYIFSKMIFIEKVKSPAQTPKG